MFEPSALLLIAAVAAVGVLHTMVPDHWVPITLIARRDGWSNGETAQAALQAGTGHILSTLILALVVWCVGVAAAEQFGQIVDTAASLTLIAFGGWIAISAWLDLRQGRSHQGHSHAHVDGHGPDHLTPGAKDTRGPEFAMHPIVDHHRHEHSDWTGSTGEHRHHAQSHHHQHGRENPFVSTDEDNLYKPLAVAVAMRHRHAHRHGESAPSHVHWHDHLTLDSHPITLTMVSEAPLHRHRHKTRGRITLLLILGSSPMIEGIPAFFAAERFGAWVLMAMALVFAISTTATYVLLCVYSTAGLQRVRLGPLERHGEVLSGAVIAAVGLAFWVWPVV